MNIKQRTTRELCIDLAELVSDVLVYEGYTDKDVGQLVFDCLAEGLIQSDPRGSVLQDAIAIMEARIDSDMPPNEFGSETDKDDNEGGSNVH